jgi:addiction module RelE/StbE family toxin
MVKIIWTKRSFKDLEKIFLYVANDSELYATRLIERIISIVDQLEHFPFSGKIVPEKNDETIRELIEGNYRIFYKVVSNSRISILRVHHSAKNVK